MKSIALITFGDKNTITDDKKVDISSKKYNFILIAWFHEIRPNHYLSL